MPTPEEALIADILLGSPGHLSGTRPIHAPGIAATGWFQATGVAGAYTAAAHFDGHRVPVTVRFSDGTGLPLANPAAHTVRGMAVKFHLGAVAEDANGVLHSTTETDMIGVELGVFFCRTIDLFREFCVATTPVKVPGRSWWVTIHDLLTLSEPPQPEPGTMSNETAVFQYANSHSEACPAVAGLGATAMPESYVTCTYHPVHAFKLTSPDGVIHYVRFHWEPVVGVRAADDPDGTSLPADLRRRVADRQAEFVLRAQVADQGDDLVDVTRPWPQSRRRLVLGHLTLTAVPADQVNGCERLSFNPTTLVDGIAYCPDDLILQERAKVYPVSFAQRAATWSPA